MAFDRGSRTNNGRASSLCSTTTIVVVAICLVGAWMITSTTVTPVDMSTLSTESETSRIVVPEADSRSSSHISRSDDPPTGSIEDIVPRNKLDAKLEIEETKNVVDEPQKDVPDRGNAGTLVSRPEKEETKNVVDEPRKDVPDRGNAGTLVSRPEKEETKNVVDEPRKDVPDRGNVDTFDSKPEKEETKNVVDEPPQKDVPDRGNADTFDSKPEKEETKNAVDKPQEDVLDKGNADTLVGSGDTSNENKGAERNDQTYGTNMPRESEETENNKLQPEEENKPEQLDRDKNQADQVPATVKIDENKGEEEEPKSESKEDNNQTKEQDKLLPSAAQSELLNETNIKNEMWPTQIAESKNEREVQGSSTPTVQIMDFEWKLCNTTVGADYIPCLDNVAALKNVHNTMHYEHRERHCPENAPTCLVPLPDGYKQPIQWPESRDKVRYNNVPHTQLAEYKGHQNWVKVSGEHLIFPGGGTQFIHGALHYIDFIQESFPEIGWGRRSRVILDVGCGVASFGGYLFDRNALTMSFAPKDEHEAQVQFALERGIPAISAVMGTKRLPFPSKVFDAIHCARCRVPWHAEGGMLLLELNRMLRPGGYFIWSATPVYRKGPEDAEIWAAMSELTKSMCWKMVSKRNDETNQVGLAIYEKPSKNNCYQRRTENNPPLCQESDDPDAAWNISLQACMHKVPEDLSHRGLYWPEEWPQRLRTSPYWLNNSQIGVYGKPAREDFVADYEHWKRVVSKSYVNGLGIDWSTVRNVMDMRSVYGGFAAALKDMSVWVMNIVSINEPDTLPIIYERGLFGMYHDWCESFSTYPRSYDLLHADQLFSKLKNRCDLVPVFVEVDRILRPEGKLIVRDNSDTTSEIENIARSLHWEIRLTYSQGTEGLLCIQKTMWRPTGVAQ